MPDIITNSSAIVFYPEYPFVVEGEGRKLLSDDLRLAAARHRTHLIHSQNYEHSYMICKISLWDSSIVPYTQKIKTHRRDKLASYHEQFEKFKIVMDEIILWLTAVEGLTLPPITYYTSELQPIINQLQNTPQPDIRGDRIPYDEREKPFGLPMVTQIFTTHNYNSAYKTWDNRVNFCYEESPDCLIININH